MKKITSLMMITICVCLMAGIGAFIYNAEHQYKINKDFISIPLEFNPYDSSSSYQMQNVEITVYGGFVKGIQKVKDGTKSLVIRALSPLPTILIKGNSSTSILLQVENVNPDFYAKCIAGNNLPMTKVKVNTLQLSISVRTGEMINIKPVQPSTTESMEKKKYIIFGDNRDGYNTFEQIIQQVNGQNPVFAIDNGDLVFSGKPNQYRLFDRMISKISTTLCTTPGNHDIRDNGRSTYTMLYGPAYYSFDYGDNHYAFLDSSPGWAEKRAISDQQYTWLEKDLAKAQGKHIFVITHIPPEDPRSNVTTNEIPSYTNQVENGDNWVEMKLDNYNESKDMDHGFQDMKEAAKFENIMSKYQVDSVYLSHIHSYLEYTKNGVRYLISGGAGAELLTKNSYYNYMIADVGDINKITMVELPSPANNYLTRYAATIQLFASAMYDENPVAVVLIIIGFILLVLLLALRIYMREKKPLDNFWRWISDTAKYSAKHFKELFLKRTD